MLELTAFALWCFAVAWIGGLAGIVMGNLRLPVVLLVVPIAASAAGTNVGISAIAAGSASVAHLRAGRIYWRLFIWMAPPSVVGALAGGYLSGVMPERVLLAFIAAVLFYGGFELLRWRKSQGVEEGSGSQRFSAAAAALTGAVIGVLGGVVGLLLGSLRMPALIKYVGVQPSRAVGTNIAVGFCVGVAGVAGHMFSAPPDWSFLGVGAAASIPGALLGSRLTGRLSEQQLVRAIAAVVFVAAIAAAARAIVG